MAFDTDLQHMGVVPGVGRIETGWFDFTVSSAPRTGAVTQEVATKLNKCYGGFAIGQTDANGRQHTVLGTTDGSVSATMTITFTRMGQYDGADARMAYIVFGH